jgi:hypothetical protein
MYSCGLALFMSMNVKSIEKLMLSPFELQETFLALRAFSLHFNKRLPKVQINLLIG